MKKLVVAVLMAGMVMSSLVACGNTNDAVDENTIIGGDPATWGPELEDETDSKDEENNDVQIPSPIVNYDSLDEVIANAGFNFVAPDSIDGYDGKLFSVYAMGDEENTLNMIEVIYGYLESEIAEQEVDTVTIRKAQFDENGASDISGVFIDFEDEKEVVQDEVNYTLKGDNGEVNVVTWTAGDYNFSVYISDGMSETDALFIATQVK